MNQAALAEFERINGRVGVRGVMWKISKRPHIKGESPCYEKLKHTGEYSIIGLNTFLSSEGSPTELPKDVTRATEEKKDGQIAPVKNVQQASAEGGKPVLRKFQAPSTRNMNMFTVMVDVQHYCSQGELPSSIV